MTKHVYSPLFATIYDEPAPLGNLGRGAHYSILSAVQWLSPLLDPLGHPSIQRLAVVWDEDHDERIVSVLERAYMQNLLAPVVMVGERKASMTIVVDDSFMPGEEFEFSNYEEEWSEVCDGVLLDTWSMQIVRMSEISKAQIINDDVAKVRAYVQNIALLWNLGHHKYSGSVNLVK